MSFLKRFWTKLSARTPAKLTPPQVVSFYQQFGFFSDVTPPEVLAAYKNEFTGFAEPPEGWGDVFLLSLSHGRVWQGDPEADVCRANQVYASTLPDWFAISGGAFAPTDINEHWESDTGPIAISFQLGSKRHTIQPKYLDDYLDLDILKQINALIAHSGRQFAYASDVNFAIVLCLTAEERKRLEKERAFPFAW